MGGGKRCGSRSGAVWLGPHCLPFLTLVIYAADNMNRCHFQMNICPVLQQEVSGAQWLSGRVLDLRQRGRGFEPHRRHCVVSLSKNITSSLVLVQPRKIAGPHSAVGNVSGYRCVSDCRSRGREFDPGPVPYFRGNWSWNDFYGHSPTFRWFIQEGLLSVTSESMCTNYWLTACSSLPRKKYG